MLKKILNVFKNKFYNRIYNVIKTGNDIKSWIKNDRIGSPPQKYRHKIIKLYAQTYKISVLIETGTYLGKTIEAVKKKFEKIYSIELNGTLYNKAKEKFSKDKFITIIRGDSSKELPKILNKIDKPCLFWLDAHYSGGITSRGDLETPILLELQCILNHSNQDHIILIDDANHFTGKKEYPSISELKEMIKEFPEKVLIIKDNIIRIHKKLINFL